MKKIIFTVMLMCCISLQAQLSTLVINNYSSFYLYGRFGAEGLSGNCLPSVNAPVDGDHIIQPYALNVAYKYYNSNLAATPVNNWWVQTSPTSPAGPRPYFHPTLTSAAVISTNTDWAYYWFQTKDSALLPYDDFKMGIPSVCHGPNVTYQSGVSSDAEWFSIGDFTYVQIF